MTALHPAWLFDGSDIPDPHGRGQRAVEFLRALRHPQSVTGGFDLPFFWERIIRRIYGPANAAGRRQVKTAFIMIPRGARKTTIGAGLALMHTFGHERVIGGQIVVAASTEEQATFAADEARTIVHATPWLAKAAKVTESLSLIEHRKSGTALETISSDGDAQHGRTPALLLADEMHAWKGRKLWAALNSAMAKKPGTLSIIITTAGRGTSNVAHEQYTYARKVAANPDLDPGFLPVLFEAPPGCDWEDEAIWHAVNPGLAEGFPDLDGLRKTARQAREIPSEREDFRQYHLNIWLDHSAAPFVEMSVYDEGSDAVDLEALEGEPCWIAVDMGLNIDLTAVVACWRDGEDGFQVAAWFFVPADNLRAKADRDRVPYPRWAEEGFIIPTPGPVTDYRAVEQHLRDLCERFDVQELVFDPAYAQAVMGPLTEDGFPTATMRQGWVTMAPAIKELERAIIGRRFRHGGNPVLRWCFENVAVETDKAGNKSFHKGKSRDRIDGAVAAAMAVARASAGGGGGSIYDTEERPEGLLVL